MKGFKAFDSHLMCKNFQYEIGHTYEFTGEPIPCNQGFHFCKTIGSTYLFYPASDNTRICEIEASGKIKTDDGIKFCTNKITIVREITDEVLKKVNINSTSTGYCNTGNYNTGYYNTGDYNAGDYNTGNRNTGGRNTGRRNTGHRNTGDYNSGHWNTGHRNTGNYNTGNYNTGHCNTGHRNTGDYNSGDYNIGNRNTGNCNTGNWNTGEWNTGSRNTGVFCTETHNLLFFDHESDLTFGDWRQSKARKLLRQIPRNVVEWIKVDNMTEEEKEQYPTYETTGGFLKVLDQKDSAQMWWDGLSEYDRSVIYAIPNFDKEKFEKCIGITIGHKGSEDKNV